MKLQYRIYLLPALATASFVVMLMAVGWTASGTSRQIGAVGTASYPYLDISTRLSTEVDALVATVQGAVAEGSEERLNDAMARKQAGDALLKAIAAIDGKAEVAAGLQQHLDRYAGAANRTALIMLDKAKGDQAAAVAEMQQAHRAIDEALKATVAEARQQLDSGLAASRVGVTTMLQTMAGAALLMVLGLGLASWWLARSIWGQIGGEPEYARDMLARMAAGDLSQTVEVKGDERSLLAALRDMARGLAGIVASVRHGSDQVAVASREIAGSNQDLSVRTEQQASALQATASSVEEMSRTVHTSAEAALQANRLATTATEVAQRGGSVVAEVVQTMAQINDSSKRIREIIGVIDGIAFQTNILALNAAVEAARAGEQGRGFAVVASEVRTLAQRSADAAREIKALIGSSVERVEAGTRLVENAGATMDEIVDSVKRVSQMIAEVSGVAGEQNTGIGHIGGAVSRLDHMTQQNAALVEQSASAAESMRDQAARLAALVSTFRLDPSDAVIPGAVQPSGA